MLCLDVGACSAHNPTPKQIAITDVEFPLHSPLGVIILRGLVLESSGMPWDVVYMYLMDIYSHKLPYLHC